MTIEPDPKPDTIADSDDDFDKHFSEFASGQKPAPDEEKDKDEDAAPDGNGPAEDEPSAPADEGKSEEKSDDEPDKAATDEEDKTDDATSGDAKDKDGGKPSGEAPDKWAGLSDEQKALIEQLEREKEEAIHRASSDANRVAALSRKLHQLQTAKPSGEKPQSEEPTEAQKALDSKIKQLKEEYGDIAEPLIELIENQRKELTTVRTQLEGLSEAQQAQVIAVEAAALEERHPDWRNIAVSPDFNGWLQVQPENIQRLASSWDARETSVVLTLFKAERAEATGQGPDASEKKEEPKPKPDAATGEKRSQQLDGGRDVRSRPAPAASGPPEDFDAAFDFFTKKRQLSANRR